MATVVFLNGRVVEAAEARVSALDAGIQHGIGVFETMLGGVREGGGVWVQRLEEHVARLRGSASDLELSTTLRAGPLEESVLETVRRSGLARARVRLTITAGDVLWRGAAAGDTKGEGSGGDPTVMIVAQAAAEYPAAMYEKGIAVGLADARANPLNPQEGHKTLNYWWRIRELQHAGRRGFAEAIVLQVTNHICGGCVSNVILVKGDELLTPIARGEEGSGRETDERNARLKGGGSGAALSSPVLPGVTRAAVMECAHDMGLAVRTSMLSVQDVLDADEVLLTNSSWGVLPVVRLEGSEIGGGRVGAVGRALMERTGAVP